ncbi:MAG TPA: hypothetical protein VD704_01695 [Gaiellaceae bacterium]|nr:hypothetical protein [Gaiellaceae bacterium]
MSSRRAIGVVLGGALALILAAGCGGGGGGGGGGGDLQAEAAEVAALADRIEALGAEATTAPALSQELQTIRAEVQTAIEDVQGADAPEELEVERDKLASRLRALRTQLGRVQGLAAAGDLEGAQAAVTSLLSIAQIRETLENIEAGASPGER